MNSTKENPVEIIRTRNELQARVRAWKQAGETVGFVPTMGALHEGHLSLIEKAQEKVTRTVASIFVNPAQFAPGEDFDTYPRREGEDIAKLASVNCDAVYLPTVAEMYPEGSVTNVRVESLSDLLDGIYRPHFFYGVATVVARLFLHAQPDVAVFGEKDYQQLQVIRRMVRDLGFPIEIIGGATRRDADGLAQSSRNLYLSPDERRAAGAIYSAMHRAASRMALGTLPSEALKEAEGYILTAGFRKIDYVTLVDPATLQALPADTPLEDGAAARLLAAAWIGKTRLIDNISVTR
ncbi:pantoate--beta-alanine ligase [Hyphomonas neptunium ATCC 15444]|uniref:Pantothenate synthetase n=2 Tax=Hyphomonas TaxID=85 RepID=PANC_HYPNA|nr:MULTISPECIES: pantoate--beta-alanine ligase [Hyphomonas]Q0C347.1 RecName: Full=Pantothenate synthetase; Short=PS; AltName: Full=Pantoate--beta-alanine ligase; AltName: Full=Pantoate-activating enzyme [Hyphomonas neptunium ATCC 15444]ABI76807.1 pantoate--beta-alanine ligase [Hyphomonas neptunium ATCC 15444]KCZ95918.1 pantoate--beta-alanine ligase [Hyphomonas hirschiana VP5]